MSVISRIKAFFATRFDRFASRLIASVDHRAPDFVVWADKERGFVYLNRWWLLPRNPIFNLYLHQFLHSDDDRALHDHPWVNMSILLRGGYTERVPLRQDQANGFDYMPGHYVDIERTAGDFAVRVGHHRHRLILAPGTTCWTLFITGPVYRLFLWMRTRAAWGFYCRHGFVPWKEFTSARDKGSVGRGCA
jgi:hypothetical protein